MKYICVLFYIMCAPMCQFYSSKYDQGAAGEVTVSLNVCFSKPLIMYIRDSVSLNPLDFEFRISRKVLGLIVSHQMRKRQSSRMMPTNLIPHSQLKLNMIFLHVYVLIDWIIIPA